MARREVIEVICDRCGRTETQEPSQTTAAKCELIIEFEGDRKEYTDLCMRCRKACEGYFKSLTKQSDKEDQGDTPPAEPAKTGVFGLGGKK